MVAVGLGAVVPDGLLVLDHEGEDVLGLLARGSGEVEATEEAMRLWLAGLVEGGLGDGVVLGQEVELDHITDFSDYVLRLEVETLVCGCAAGEDAVDDTRWWGNRGGGVSKAQEGGGSKGNGSEGDHVD